MTKLAEVEITESMIEAGAELCSYLASSTGDEDYDWTLDRSKFRDYAVDIFKAMVEAHDRAEISRSV